MPSIGQTNKNYISSVNFLDKREILDKILDVTNEDKTILDWMEMTGRQVQTDVPVYHQFVNEERYETSTVASGGGATAGGAGQTVDITLNNSTAGGSYPIVGDLILLDDKTIARVTAKSNGTGDTITLKPVDDTVTLDISDGDVLAAISNAQQEANSGVSPRRYGYKRYENQTQIFENSFEISDVQLASKIEVEFRGQPYYLVYGQHENLMKFRQDIAHAYLFGEKSTAKFSDDTGQTQTTQGLYHYIDESGVNYGDTASANTFTSADLKGITTELRKRRSPSDYLMLHGHEGTVAIDDWLNNLTSTSSNLQGARFDVNKYPGFNIDGFKMYGFNFMKMYMPTLDHKGISNFNGSAGYERSIFFVPMDKISTKDGQKLDRFRTRYMAGNTTNMLYQEINTGAYAPNGPTSEEKKWKQAYTSNQGLEVLGAQHFVHASIKS